jgi:hypothetical protein
MTHYAAVDRGTNQHGIRAYYGTVVAEENCIGEADPGHPNAFNEYGGHDATLTPWSNEVGPDVDCRVPDGALQSVEEIGSVGGVTGGVGPSRSSGSPASETETPSAGSSGPC